jgi:hypothetical protein
MAFMQFVPRKPLTAAMNRMLGEALFGSFPGKSRVVRNAGSQLYGDPNWTEIGQIERLVELDLAVNNGAGSFDEHFGLTSFQDPL